jgi:hypothetical protein
VESSKEINERKYFSCSWANDTLHYAVCCLKGKNIVSRLSGRISIALLLRDRLNEEGFWWQAKVLEAWIHRAQRGDFGK